MRRNAPTPERIEELQHRASETLATAIEVDLRHSNPDRRDGFTGLSGPASPVDPNAHEAISHAITSWWLLLGAICGSSVGGRPDVEALLLAGASLGQDPTSQDCLEVVLSDTDAGAAVADARAALTWALEPVYTSVRNHYASGISSEVTAAGDVDRARTIVAEVVARSAFADA
jgi:hypothetical protein